MTHPFAPCSLRPTPKQIERHLRRTMEVAERAVSMGRHPFGAILVAPDNETVLMEQCNIDTVNHVSSRYVFDHCQKAVDLIGPVPSLEAEIAAQQQAFWARR